MRATFPLTERFRADNRIKAFVLSSMIAATVIALTIEFRLALEDWEITKSLGKGVKLLIDFLTAFTIALVVFGIAYFFFDYGTGMLTCEGCSRYNDLRRYRPGGMPLA